MATKTAKCNKLCKRTYFLRHGSVPTQSEMRYELGSELADSILGVMSPACRAWMGVDKKLLGPAVYCLDSNELKANIHEHILHLGKDAEDKLKRKRKRLAKKKDLSEEFEFIKFECRQKIEIARDEERKRMQEQLSEAKLELEEKFRVMKVELGEDYLRVRKEMARFMCRNLRTQAQHLIRGITRKYREELDKEVSLRVNMEIQQLSEQIDNFVQRAVEKQKAIDTMAMQKMCYRYEELIKNAQNRQACHQLTQLTREICSCWAELFRVNNNPATSCQTSFTIPTPSYESSSVSTQESEGFVGPSEMLELDDVFFIETCPMMPDADPTYSVVEITSEIVSNVSSLTLEAFTMDGKVYAQPQYYRKVYEQLFPTPMLTWEPLELDDDIQCREEEIQSIDSDFVREIVGGILTNEQIFEETSHPITEPDITSGTHTPEPSISEISGLFDLEQSDSAIELLVNGITLKYIRATEKDFD